MITAMSPQLIITYVLAVSNRMNTNTFWTHVMATLSWEQCMIGQLHTEFHILHKFLF
jgi:hypothetical protein